MSPPQVRWAGDGYNLLRSSVSIHSLENDPLVSIISLARAIHSPQYFYPATSSEKQDLRVMLWQCQQFQRGVAWYSHTLHPGL